MSNSAGEGADRLHLLCLTELRLESLLVQLCLVVLRHIARGAHEPDWLALGVSHTAASRMQPAPLAVGTLDSIFNVIARRKAFEVSLARGIETRPVVRVKVDVLNPFGARLNYPV